MGKNARGLLLMIFSTQCTDVSWLLKTGGSGLRHGHGLGFGQQGVNARLWPLSRTATVLLAFVQLQCLAVNKEQKKNKTQKSILSRDCQWPTLPY